MNLSTNKYKLPELHIGNKTARIPIIQGGMGVGVSGEAIDVVVADVSRCVCALESLPFRGG